MQDFAISCETSLERISFKSTVHVGRTDKAHISPSRLTFFCSLCAWDLTTGPKMIPPPRHCTTLQLLMLSTMRKHQGYHSAKHLKQTAVLKQGRVTHRSHHAVVAEVRSQAFKGVVVSREHRLCLIHSDALNLPCIILPQHFKTAYYPV